MNQEEILKSPKFQMEAALIRKCSEEPEFRAKVLANPKGMLEEALGQKLPENISVFIHEEDLHTLHFAVPPTREALKKELTDEQLEQIAGGTDPFAITASLAITAALAPYIASISLSVATVTATATVATLGSAVGTAIGVTVGKSKGW
jgi:hypothetical protein